jgi:hypothetical protein
MQLLTFSLGLICLAWAVAPTLLLIYGGANRDEIAAKQKDALTGETKGLLAWIFRSRLILGWLGGVLLVAALLI